MEIGRDGWLYYTVYMHSFVFLRRLCHTDGVTNLFINDIASLTFIIYDDVREDGARLLRCVCVCVFAHETSY